VDDTTHNTEFGDAVCK